MLVTVQVHDHPPARAPKPPSTTAPSESRPCLLTVYDSMHARPVLPLPPAVRFLDPTHVTCSSPFAVHNRPAARAPGSPSNDPLFTSMTCCLCIQRLWFCRALTCSAHFASSSAGVRQSKQLGILQSIDVRHSANASRRNGGIAACSCCPTRSRCRRRCHPGFVTTLGCERVPRTVLGRKVLQTFWIELPAQQT